jgi:hypothetical protein
MSNMEPASSGQGSSPEENDTARRLGSVVGIAMLGQTRAAGSGVQPQQRLQGTKVKIARALRSERSPAGETA